MDRQGRVRQLYEDGTALVLLNGSCSLDCGSCGSCHRKTVALVAQNPQGALPGELVLVRTRRGSVLMAALMLLGLPIACFFAGYWIGEVFGNAGGAIGCIALALGVGAGLVYDRLVASKPGGGYRLLRYSQKHNKGDNGFD